MVQHHYQFMSERWVLDSPFIINPRIYFEVLQHCVDTACCEVSRLWSGIIISLCLRGG